MVDFLLKNRKYDYFSISICLANATHFNQAIRFINALENYSFTLFDEVLVELEPRMPDINAYNKFCEIYLAKGFEQSKIKVSYSYLDMVSLADRLIKRNKSLDFAWTDEFHTVFWSETQKF